LSPELQAAVNEFRTTIEQTKADIAAWKARESEKIDLLSNCFEKMDLLGNPGAGFSEEHGREFWALPFANRIPGVDYAGPSSHKSWRAHLAQGSAADLQAALSVGSDGTGGGYLVPAFVSSKIDSIAFESSPVRQYARIEKIDEDAFEEPQQRGDLEVEWVGETQARLETDTPPLGKFRVPLHEMHSQPRNTQKFLDTNSYDAEGWLTGQLGDSFGRKEATAFVTGDGELKPRGFLTYPTAATADATRAWGTLQHVATGVGSDFPATGKATYDILVDVITALKAPYRAGATWFANRRTVGVLMKIKDDQGQPIWHQSIDARRPSTMLGYPVIEAEDMPDVAADALPIAFGNFKRGYIIVDHRKGMRILRDPYTAKPWVLFDTYRRVGGGVYNFETIKLVKVATS